MQSKIENNYFQIMSRSDREVVIKKFTGNLVHKARTILISLLCVAPTDRSRFTHDFNWVKDCGIDRGKSGIFNN